MQQSTGAAVVGCSGRLLSPTGSNGSASSLLAAAHQPHSDNKRRFRKTRNQSEKRRRDTFNRLIAELSAHVCDGDSKLDKSNVLKHTITFLKQQQQQTALPPATQTSLSPPPAAATTSTAPPIPVAAASELDACSSGEQQLSVRLQSLGACLLLCASDGCCFWHSANASAYLPKLATTAAADSAATQSPVPVGRVFDAASATRLQQLISNQLLLRAAPAGATPLAGHNHSFRVRALADGGTHPIQAATDKDRAWLRLCGRFLDLNKGQPNESQCLALIIRPDEPELKNPMSPQHSQSLALIHSYQLQLLAARVHCQLDTAALSFACLIDEQAMMLTVEKRVAWCLGYTAQELVGHSVYELCHSGDVHRLNIITATATANSQRHTLAPTQHFALRLRHRQGGWVYVRLECTEVSSDSRVLPVQVHINNASQAASATLSRKRYVCSCTLDSSAPSRQPAKPAAHSTAVANFSIAALKSDATERAVVGSVSAAESLCSPQQQPSPCPSTTSSVSSLTSAHDKQKRVGSHSNLLIESSPLPSTAASSPAAARRQPTPRAGVVGSEGSDGRTSVTAPPAEKVKRQSNVWIESLPIPAALPVVALSTANTPMPSAVAFTYSCTAPSTPVASSVTVAPTAVPTGLDASVLSESDRAIWQQEENRRFALLQQVWAQQRELLQLQQFAAPPQPHQHAAATLPP